MPKKDLLMVNTGDGKGKTTAALGTAFRALGHGMRVCVIQFIKGTWMCGELEAAKRFEDLLEIHVKGGGFTWQSEDLEEDIRIAREAWRFATDTIAEGRHELMILDELTYLIEYEMVPERDILDVLANRPAGMHVIVTGRNASDGLIAVADLVTEMAAVKHPHDEGISAQKGIEF